MEIAGSRGSASAQLDNPLLFGSWLRLPLITLLLLPLYSLFSHVDTPFSYLWVSAISLDIQLNQGRHTIRNGKAHPTKRVA